jgi:thioredoxin reductase/NAD-dependent dihydropyrimidine dehydrogenase PreA subunit
METDLIWVVAALVCAAIFVPYAVGFYRRNAREAARQAEAVHLGANRPVAQYPLIDENKCLGCGTCVAACPEHDVLGIVNGRAVIVNGLRCIGHGRCAEACPVGALRVGLGDVGAREDIPLLSPDNETSVPGVFIAGELSGFALIRNAVRQGTSVVEKIAARLRETPKEPTRAPASDGTPHAGPVLDLIVVGAGPAGLSAALTARREKLSCVVLEQEKAGGAILQYPRKKVVLTQPVELPLYGRLDRSEYTKEELLEILDQARQRFELDVRAGEKVEGLVRRPDGLLAVRTGNAEWLARSVILALGRRGTPRKLGVAGEQLSKVAYKLMDAESFKGEHILVIGGGDSAVEAALGLANQPGNTVALSYRKESLFRIKKRNELQFASALEGGVIQTFFNSEVKEILPEQVKLRQNGLEMDLPNDHVFVFAGGEPPYPLLQRMGVKFGGTPAAEDRPAAIAPPPAAIGAPVIGR